MKELTSELKAKIWGILQKIQKDGYVTVAAVAPELKAELGIEWKEYTELRGPGALKKWLCSEFQVTEDTTNNYRVYIKSEGKSGISAALKEKIEGLLVANLNEEGYLMNSAIPVLLRNNGIEWKKQAGEKVGLEEWLEKEFPAFWIDKSGKAPCIRLGRAMNEPNKEEEAGSYPILVDPDSEDSKDEVARMHNFAFMGWWTNTAKLLRNLTGFSGNNEDRWRAVIAHQLAVSKLNLGKKTYFEQLNAGEDTGIAFDTGLKRADGKSIYGVFGKKPRGKEGYQEWQLTDFCYPGQKGAGQWLERIFGLASEEDNDFENIHNELVEEKKELLLIQEELLTDIDNLVEIVKAGQILESASLVKLNRYGELWTSVQEKLSKINAAVLKNSLTLTELDVYLSGNEVYHEILEQAVGWFGEAAKTIYDCLKEAGLISGEYEATIMWKDYEKIKNKYGSKKSIVPDFVEFIDILSYYKAFRVIVKSLEVTEEFDVAADKAAEHFDIKHSAIARYLRGWGQLDALENIENIEEKLEVCINAQKEKKAEIPLRMIEAEQPVSNMLSSSVKEAFAEKQVSKDSIEKHFVSVNKFEELIIRNQMENAQLLCSNISEMTALGYSQEEIERISSILRYKKEMPGSLKEYFCAYRLMQIQRNKNRQAEKYYLLADKTNDTVTALLDIYRREERIEDFLFVYRKFSEDYNIDYTNKSFVLQIYAKCGWSDKLSQLILKHPELAYDIENLTYITGVFKDNAQYEDLEAELSARRLRLEEEPNLNPFEEVLEACDKGEIISLVNDKESLLSYGYSEDEITAIERCMLSGDYPEQTDEFETGCRIYAFQKNKHGLAEQYLWKGLKNSNLAAQSLKIFAILNEEKRWDESCALYNAYEAMLTSVEAARKYYIIALLHTDVDTAFEMLTENLLDFLDENVFACLKSISYTGDRRELVEQLGNIHAKIDNEYIAGVVYIRPALRDYIVHPERLEEFGINPKEAEEIVAVYKNDTFCYGTSALEIAKRVYAFWKNRNNLAAMFAKLELPKEQAAEVLNRIYAEEQEYDKQKELFESFPDLLKNSPADYLKILFYQEEYEKYVEVYALLEEKEKTPLLQAEAIIAEAAMGKRTDIQNVSGFFTMETIRTMPWLLIRLASVLNRKEDAEFMVQLLRLYFDAAAGSFTTEIQQQTEKLLSSLEWNADIFKRIASVLTETEHLGSAVICRSLYSACKDSMCLEACLDLFADYAVEKLDAGILSKEYGKFISSIFSDVILTERFPQELLKKAIHICEKYMEQEGNSETAFCLSYLYKQSKEERMAELAWQYIMEGPESEISEAALKYIIEQQEYEQNLSQHPVYRIFMETLRHCTAEETGVFVASARNLVRLNQRDVYFAKDIENREAETVYSDDECVHLLKLLFRNPDSGNYWKACENLPIINEPELYAKVLYNIAKFGAGEWKRCVVYCEKYQLKRLMFDAIKQWICNAPDINDAIDCQKVMTRLVNDTNYLEEFDDKDILKEIVEGLCATYNMPYSYEMKYEALRSIAVTAIACDMEDILYDRLADVLATESAGGDVGTVAICTLLLKGRIPYAYKLLQKLAVSYTPCSLKPLINELAAYTEKELEEHVKEEVLRNVLELSLPKGHLPNEKNIGPFILNAIQEKKHQSAALTMNFLLDLFGTDIVCAGGLLTVCKEVFEGYEKYLQRGLAVLALIPQNQRNVFLYQMGEKPYKKWFCMMTAVVEQKYNGETLLTDFHHDEPISAFYKKCNPGAVIEEITELTEDYNTVKSWFDNRSSEEKELLYEAVAACVTGNWQKVIYNSYNEKRSITLYEKELFTWSNDGIVKSASMVMQQMPPEEQDAFYDWLIKWIADYIDMEETHFANRLALLCGKNPRQTEETREIRRLLYEDDVYKIEDVGKYLQYPLEERFIYEFAYKKIMEDITLEEMYDAYLAIGVLTMNQSEVNLWMKRAQYMFANGDDTGAYRLYRVLYLLGKYLKLYGDYKATNGLRKKLCKIQYLCRTTIAGCFIGQHGYKECVGSEKFTSWDCANMVMQLLNSPRAKEVERLKLYFSPNNRKLCDAVVKCLSKEYSDEEKLLVMKSFLNPIARYVLCDILLYKNDKGQHLNNSESFAIVTEEMRKAKEDIKDRAVVENGNVQFLLNKPMYIHISFYQKSENVVYEMQEVSVTEIQIKRDLPEFIKRLEERSQNEALESESLEQLQQKYDTLALEDLQSRKKTTEQLYLAAKKEGAAEEILDDYIIQTGLDTYRCDGDESVLLETAKYSMAINKQGQACKKLKQMSQGVLHKVLRSYECISDLVNSYKNNKEAFVILRNYIDAEKVQKIVGKFYSVIEEMVTIYSSVVISDNNALKDKLSAVHKKIEDIDYKECYEWTEVKKEIQSRIYDEINRLDRRPILICEVLNEGVNTACGRIYGQISNIGRERADNITLQASINGEASKRYQLNMLYPENKAAFEIDYSVDSDVTELFYEIMISYSHKGESYSVDNSKGKLIISEAEDYRLPDYNLSTIRTFTSDENGRIVSGTDNIFFGRNTEKEKVKNTFSDAFAGYKDTLIRGVRRAGKTSLLNYISVYIENNSKEDVAAIVVDCQGATASGFIQSVFVDMVCDKLERTLPELTQSTEWTMFRKEWSLPEGEQDRAPQSLEKFYFRLYQQLGNKKLVLIFDEVDTLFEKVSEKQGLDANLFPALGAMLCSNDMPEIVHFVFCGSNNLIRYSMDGGVLNQFFQRFGNVIEVGRMPNKDLNEMLEKSWGMESDIVYTKEALDWISRLTGGMVWHSKILGQEIIKRLRNENRNVVYPSDVCHGIASIASDDFCKQFLEGCGEVEGKIIDAIQSLTDHEREFVFWEDVAVLLAGQYDKVTLERSVNLLVKLDILKKSRIDGKDVFGYTIDLYRRYFKNRLSMENRRQEADTLFRSVYVKRKRY